MNAFAQTGDGNGRSLPGKVLSWLMSWGPPVVIGLAYFAAYYPGFTNHDSQSMWLNAFQYVGDPATIPVMDWYAPGLTLLRILALESGLGVAGYHALFCQLTFGTWALLVAALLDHSWQRLCAHGLLLLPFIGANLAFQVPDTWAAVGLAWWIAALMVFTWRLAQGRLTHLDAAWMTLIAAYYLTILLFAPVYLPRYVFPAWVVLGVGTMRLLLNPGARGSFRDRAGTT